MIFYEIAQQVRHNILFFRISELRENPAESVHIKRSKLIFFLLIDEFVIDIILALRLDILVIMRYKTAKNVSSEAETEHDFIFILLTVRLGNYFFHLASSQLYLYSIKGVQQQ